jgi:putative ABC transport system substrate-binding protein
LPTSPRSTGISTGTYRSASWHGPKPWLPSASKILYLTTRTSAGLEQPFREASRRLRISVIRLALEQSTPSEIERAFAQIASDPPDAFIVDSIGDLAAHHQLIVELVEKSGLPAIYPWREYVEAGGLMAYEADLVELYRRMADDVHQILSGAKPGDIPIHQPSKYELIINLRTAKALGLTIPPSLLDLAEDVIE